ncbi:glycosyltransferase [Haloplanus natans]|uniref:glycosyltransferase n=1 Tax=Haloplanus natans TaxID=376171 RepID=UPI000677FE29|nr:glycosyltransferase [Haloplanus natans]
MRVAFLVNAFPKLSETFLLNQITGLVDDGHSVDIYAIQRTDEDLTHARIADYDLLDRTTYLSVEGADWLRVAPPIAYRALVDVVRDPAQLGRVLSHRRDAVRLTDAFRPVASPLLDRLDGYDAIHAHFGPIGNGFRFLAERTDAPFIVSFYGYDVKEALGKHPRRYGPLFDAADAVTVLSEDMREKVEDAGCPPSKTTKIPLCVDTSTFTFSERMGETDDRIELVSVARLVEKKGLAYAIDAVAQLADEYDVRYRIAGDGDLRSDLEERIRARGLGEQVELLGWVEQTAVSELLAEGDVFLLPSVTARSGDEEGTPTVLLEAQARGLPIVSTYHSGIPEIVADGRSGLLAPERDVDALARKLRTLFDHPELWSEMGRNGRRYVEEVHSVDTVTERLERLYTGGE